MIMSLVVEPPSISFENPIPPHYTDSIQKIGKENLFIDQDQDISPDKKEAIGQLCKEYLASNPAPIRASYTYGQYFWSCLSSLAAVPKGVVNRISGLYSDTFVDGNYSWKEQKYLIIANSIQKAFQENSRPLLMIKEKLLASQQITDLQSKTIQVIDSLYADNWGKTETIRIAYRHFIEKLREALNSPEFSKEQAKKLQKLPYDLSLDCLLDICTFRYSEVHIYSFCEDLISWIIDEGRKVLVESKPDIYSSWKDQDPFNLPLSLQFEAITAAPQKFKAPYANLLVDFVEGAFSVLYDPQRKSNMPYVLYDFEMKLENGLIQDIRVIRSCTPTMQRMDLRSFTYQGDAMIVPEFENFIIDKKVLYINLQDEKSEASRNIAFKNLMQKYPNNFFLAILAHDSNFYHQTGPYADKDKNNPRFKNAEEFWDAFLQIIMKEEEGYYFSKEWLSDESFIQKLKTIWHEVHEDLFEKKEALSEQERCIFIEAYYLRVALLLLRKTEAKYLFFSCRDSNDRGGKCNALLLKFLMILFQKQHSTKHKRIVKTYTHAAPFISKKKAMNGRKERYLYTDEWISNDHVAAKLQRRKDSIGISGEDIKLKILSDQKVIKDQHI